MKKLVVIFAVVFSLGCSKSIIPPPIEKWHKESADTSRQDTTASVVTPESNLEFNFLDYYYKLNEAKKLDSAIKYVPYEVVVQDKNLLIRIKSLENGNLELKKERDTLQFKLQNTTITNSIKDSIVVPYIPKNYCSVKIHIFYEYFTKIVGALIGIFVLVKLFKP